MSDMLIMILSGFVFIVTGIVLLLREKGPLARSKRERASGDRARMLAIVSLIACGIVLMTLFTCIGISRHTLF